MKIKVLYYVVTIPVVCAAFTASGWAVSQLPPSGADVLLGQLFPPFAIAALGAAFFFPLISNRIEEECKSEKRAREGKDSGDPES